MSRGKKSNDEGEGSKGSAGHSSARRGLAGAGRQGRGRQGGGATELLVAEELGHELLLGEDDGSEESRVCSAQQEAWWSSRPEGSGAGGARVGWQMIPRWEEAAGFGGWLGEGIEGDRARGSRGRAFGGVAAAMRQTSSNLGFV